MQKRIKGFDGLRALAVGMVILEHKTQAGNALGLGGYGVHLFFVLSGYLIISILHKNRIAIESGSASISSEIAKFYMNRVYRIWPIYYLTIFIALFIGLIGIWSPLTASEIFGTMTFTSNLFQGWVWTDYPHHVGALWSVAVEEQFYLWAGLAFLLSPSRFIVPICAGVIVLAIVYLAAMYQFGWPPRSAYVGPFVNFGLMAMGGIAAVGFRSVKLSSWVATMALFAYLMCPYLAMQLKAFSSVATSAVFFGSGLLVAVALLGLHGNQASTIVKALELRPIAYTGVISYGLYLYHGLFYFRDYGLKLGLAGSVIEIAIAYAVAAASWELLESNVLKYRDRRRARLAAQPAV